MSRALLLLALLAVGCDDCDGGVAPTLDPPPSSIRVGDTFTTTLLSSRDLANLRITLLDRDDNPFPGEAKVTPMSQREFKVTMRPLRTGEARFRIDYDVVSDGEINPSFAGKPLSGDFDVYGWQIAGLDCYYDGTVMGLAYKQDPPPTLQLVDPCLLVTGGGDPVRAAIATETCTSSTSTVSCMDGGDRCFAQAAPFGPAGTDVALSWTGGELGTASSPLSLPPLVTFAAAPTEVTRGQPYTVSFSGGDATSKVLLLAAVPHRGSTMLIDCEVPATANQLVVPAAVTSELEAGPVSLYLKNVTIERKFTGDFRVDARVNGPTIGETQLDVTVR